MIGSCGSPSWKGCEPWSGEETLGLGRCLWGQDPEDVQEVSGCAGEGALGLAWSFWLENAC